MSFPVLIWISSCDAKAEWRSWVNPQVLSKTNHFGASRILWFHEYYIVNHDMILLKKCFGLIIDHCISINQFDTNFLPI